MKTHTEILSPSLPKSKTLENKLTKTDGKNNTTRTGIKNKIKQQDY